MYLFVCVCVCVQDGSGTVNHCRVNGGGGVDCSDNRDIEINHEDQPGTQPGTPTAAPMSDTAQINHSQHLSQIKEVS